MSIAAIVIFLSACSLGLRESAVGVRGAVTGVPVGETCTLALIRAEDGRVLQVREIDPQFAQMFVIQGKTRRYKVAVACAGNYRWESSEFLAGNDARQKIDVGELEYRRPSP